jgi:hypothetical protein
VATAIRELQLKNSIAQKRKQWYNKSDRRIGIADFTTRHTRFEINVAMAVFNLT